MEFAVYIIQDTSKKNEELFNKLAGDVGLFTSVKSEGLDMTADLLGAEIYDLYTDPKIIGDTGIVISGDMISSVSIKKEMTKRELYQGGFKNPFTTKSKSTLMTTITVTGSLFAPETIQHSSSEKMKNMAKVLAWASLKQTFEDPAWIIAKNSRGTINYKEFVKIFDIDHKGELMQLQPKTQRIYHDSSSKTPNGDNANDPNLKENNGEKYESYYYRRVLVTVYSNTDQQFRAVLHDNVYVSSYEEKYDDQNGNGFFTLVMQTETKSKYDVIVEGPTYKTNVLSGLNTAASIPYKIADAADKAIQTFDNVFDLNGKFSGPIDKIASMTKNLFDPNKDLSDRFTVNNFLDRVDGGVNNYRDLKEEVPEAGKALDARFSDEDEETAELNSEGEDKKIENDINQATEYQKAYDALTPEQKDTLNYIPGFDDMSIEEKMQYVEEVSEIDFTDTATTDTTTDTTTIKTITINKANTTKTVTVTKTTDPNKSDATITIENPNQSDTIITITTKDTTKKQSD